jgi:hypothetical protein
VTRATRGGAGGRQGRPQPLTVLLAAVLAACLVWLTACSAIPTRGPVGVIPGSQGEADADAPAFSPKGPAAGAAPELILRGFITAGTGAGDGYSVARQFLTKELAETWQPEERIVLFSGEPRVEQRATEGVYQIQLETTGTVDAMGLRTNTPAPVAETLGVRMEQVDGQWRIADIPDGVMLAQSSAQELLLSHDLYFYSSNYRYWVPDARWFVRRTGVAARIVSTMLAGPAPYLKGSVTSAFAEGVTLARESVPITSGTASVELSAEVLDGATDLGLQQMNQQLQVNLVGLNDVSAVEMTSGQPIELGNPSPQLVVPELSPDVGGEQVAIADGELVRVRDRAIVPVEEMEPVAGLAPLEPATSVSGSAYAFLAGDGASLYVTAPGSQPRVVVSGESLTRPSFDPENWVWTTRTVGGGVEVLAVPPGGTQDDAAVLSAAWLAGRVVKELRVSRDGARALVVTERDGTGELLVAGITRSAEGSPQSLTTPLTLATAADLDTAVWAGQSAVVASTVGADEVAVPLILGLDGSQEPMAPLDGVLAISAGSDAEDTLYAQAGSTLYRRLGNIWVDEQLDVRDPAYPG